MKMNEFGPGGVLGTLLGSANEFELNQWWIQDFSGLLFGKNCAENGKRMEEIGPINGFFNLTH